MGFMVMVHYRREQKNKQKVLNTRNSLGDLELFEGPPSSPSTPKDTSPLRMSAPQKMTSQGMFLMIMKNEQAFKALEKFLMNEFSVENLLFLKAVMNLEESTALSTEERMTMARSIFKKFVSPHADLEVNLSSDNRQLLERLFSKEDLDLSNLLEAFALSHKEISSLVIMDSLRRFCKTEEFKSIQSSLLL
jgi:hypothetical protein